MANKTAPPEHISHRDTFPASLWMHDWYEVRDRLRDQDGNLTHAKIELVFPSWMSEKSCEQLSHELDARHWQLSPAWWSQLWIRLTEDMVKHPETGMLALAMAAVSGWPNVVSDLIDAGVPLGQLKRPDAGWLWLDEKGYRGPLDRKTACALDFCVSAMRGHAANTPLHPGRQKCLEMILEAGADPNDMAPYAVRHMIHNQKIAGMLIAAGLSPLAVANEHNGACALDVIFSTDLDLSNRVRGRHLKAFIDAGMPVKPSKDKPSLMGYIASCSHGLACYDVAMQHPDKDSLSQDLLVHMPQLVKRSRLGTKAMHEKMLAKFENDVINATTPQSASVAASRPRSRL